MGGDKKTKKSHSGGMRMKRSRSRSPQAINRHNSGKSSASRNYGGDHRSKDNMYEERRRSKFDQIPSQPGSMSRFASKTSDMASPQELVNMHSVNSHNSRQSESMKGNQQLNQS